jgi:glycosyltransferase involved in cell wall biosynthesis
MRLLLVTHTVPYPPVDGSAVDRWNRIVALARRGVSIHLITWPEENVVEPQLEALRTCCDSVAVHRKRRSPYRALLYPKYPTPVISRILAPDEFKAELRRVEGISPDAVFLDGFGAAVLGMSLAEELDIPLVYRSHNVEHQYVAQLATLKQNLPRRALLLLNTLRMKPYEQRVRNRSSLIYDISAEDRDAWRNHQSASKTKVLNFCLHPDEKYSAITSGDSTNDIDALYVGNLHTPNNVFGVKWFAQEVVPLLKGLRVVVAGSKPVPEIKAVLSRAKVQLIANPKEVLPLYKRARVLVNPIWHGSGLNIKMVEALATGKPVVSTSRGTRGLVKRLRAHVHAADSPQSFAGAVLNPAHDFSAKQQTDVLKEHGWAENVAALMQDFDELVSRR